MGPLEPVKVLVWPVHVTCGGQVVSVVQLVRVTVEVFPYVVVDETVIVAETVGDELVVEAVPDE